MHLRQNCTNLDGENSVDLMKKFFFILLVMILSFSCKEDPVSSSFTPVFSNEVLTVDTLQISAGIDTGSGFQYSQNYIDIIVTLRMSNNTLFCDVECSVNDTLFHMAAIDNNSNTVRLKRRYWLDRFHQPGSNLDYAIRFVTISSDQTRDTILVRGTSVVTSNQAYSTRENGAIQLTKGLHPYSPTFSEDGQWIYFADVDIYTSKSFVKRLSIITPNTVEVIYQNADGHMNYTLMNSDSILLVVKTPFSSNSLLIKQNLYTRSIDTVALKVSIRWGRIVEVPGGRHILAVVDSAGLIDTSPSLALVDVSSGTIQKIISRQSEFGSIDDFGIRPATNEITYCIRADNSHISVYLNNLETNKTTMCIDRIEGQRFFWAPDGISYAIINNNTFFFTAGMKQQITYYPVVDYDLSFSSVERVLTFTSLRRGRTDLWKIPY